MYALKDRVGSKLALVIAVAIGAIIGMSLVGIGAVAHTSAAKKTPVARTACRHYAEHVRSPCVVGNQINTCGYGNCEGRQDIKCKLSRELGENVIETHGKVTNQFWRNLHKQVTCKGSATILQVYIETIKHEWRPVSHTTHSVTATLHAKEEGSFNYDYLVIMAQH